MYPQLRIKAVAAEGVWEEAGSQWKVSAVIITVRLLRKLPDYFLLGSRPSLFFMPKIDNQVTYYSQSKHQTTHFIHGTNDYKHIIPILRLWFTLHLHASKNNEGKDGNFQ